MANELRASLLMLRGKRARLECVHGFQVEGLLEDVNGTYLKMVDVTFICQGMSVDLPGIDVNFQTVMGCTPAKRVGAGKF